jgi:hypothetical protein
MKGFVEMFRIGKLRKHCRQLKARVYVGMQDVCKVLVPVGHYGNED